MVDNLSVLQRLIFSFVQYDFCLSVWFVEVGPVAVCLHKGAMRNKAAVSVCVAIQAEYRPG